MDKIEFEYVIGDFRKTVILPDLLDISESTINKDLADQPGLYSYYAGLAVRCGAYSKQLKYKLAQVEASTRISIKNEYEKTGKKITADDLVAQVGCSMAVCNMQQELVAAQAQFDMAESIKESFYHRKEALKELAANMRAERSQISSA